MNKYYTTSIKSYIAHLNLYASTTLPLSSLRTVLLTFDTLSLSRSLALAQRARTNGHKISWKNTPNRPRIAQPGWAKRHTHSSFTAFQVTARTWLACARSELNKFFAPIGKVSSVSYSYSSTSSPNSVGEEEKTISIRFFFILWIVNFQVQDLSGKCLRVCARCACVRAPVCIGTCASVRASICVCVWNCFRLFDFQCSFITFSYVSLLFYHLPVSSLPPSNLIYPLCICFNHPPTPFFRCLAFRFGSSLKRTKVSNRGETKIHR